MPKKVEKMQDRSSRRHRKLAVVQIIVAQLRVRTGSMTLKEVTSRQAYTKKFVKLYGTRQIIFCLFIIIMYLYIFK